MKSLHIISKTPAVLVALLISVTLSSCLSNYVNSSQSKLQLMSLVSKNENLTFTATLDVPSDVVYLGAKRVLHVDGVSFIRFQKSHKKGNPLVFDSKHFFEEDKAGVIVGVVRKGKAYKNIGIIYVYPRGNKTEVKTYSNNTYQTLFATTNKNLLLSLKRTISLKTKKNPIICNKQVCYF